MPERWPAGCLVAQHLVHDVIQLWTEQSACLGDCPISPDGMIQAAYLQHRRGTDIAASNGLPCQCAVIGENSISLCQAERCNIEIILQKVHTGREIHAERSGNALHTFLPHLFKQIYSRWEVVISQCRTQPHGTMIDLAWNRGIAWDIPTKRGRV